MSSKKIGILTFWEFPEGMAPTARILAYSKGMVSNEAKVEIYSFRRIFKTQVDEEKIEKEGVVEGISYCYIHYFKNWGNTFKPIRVFDELLLRFKLFYKIFKSNRQEKFTAFLFSFDDLNSLPVYTKMFSLLSIPIFFVADEYPIPIRDQMMDRVPDEMIRKYKKYHTYFKGRILMSESLKRFYNEEISLKSTFVLNTIIDAKRFLNENIENSETKLYICYMGNMALKKDNVDNIVYAFSLIAEEYPDIDLYLFGTPDIKDFETIQNLINTLQLNDRVFIKGRVGFDKVPNILAQAKILVNSQPKTKRAHGGFPTKLGEYLLSGKPAIFTDSGDIAKYITDNKHAFIVPPENVELYGKKLKFILDNYNDALQVARNGKLLITEQFNAKKQTAEMLNFIESLK